MGGYVHGYDGREALRLEDQARTLEELLHGDTEFPDGAEVLEAGCGTDHGKDSLREFTQRLPRRGVRAATSAAARRGAAGAAC